MCVAYRKKFDMEEYMVKMPWPTPVKVDESSDESDTMELDVAVDNATVTAVASPDNAPQLEPVMTLAEDLAILDAVIRKEDAQFTHAMAPSSPSAPLSVCTNSQPPSPLRDVSPSASSRSFDGLALRKDSPQKPTSTVGDVMSQFLAIKQERLKLQRKVDLSFQVPLFWPVDSSDDSSLATSTTTTTTTTTTVGKIEAPPPLRAEASADQLLPAKKRRIIYTLPEAPQPTLHHGEPLRVAAPPQHGVPSDDDLTAAAAIMRLFPLVPSKSDLARREHSAILHSTAPAAVPPPRKVKAARKPRKSRKTQNQVSGPQIPAGQRFPAVIPFVTAPTLPIDYKTKTLSLLVPVVGMYTSHLFSLVIDHFYDHRSADKLRTALATCLPTHGKTGIKITRTGVVEACIREVEKAGGGRLDFWKAVHDYFVSTELF